MIIISLKIMSKYTIFRFVCLVLLWIFLCVMLISRREFDFMVLFSIVASGIIIFVPLYKKYKKNKNDK